MGRLKIFAVIIIILMPCVSFSSSQEGKITLYIAKDSLNEITPEDSTLGNYYVFRLSIPKLGNNISISGAYLEFYMNVDSRDVAGYFNDSPVIQCCLLKSQLSGEYDERIFDLSLSSARNVLAGDNKRVRLNITNILNYLLEHPDEYFGLIVGSLTGSRDGLIELKEGEFIEGGIARLTILVRDNL